MDVCVWRGLLWQSSVWFIGDICCHHSQQQTETAVVCDVISTVSTVVNCATVLNLAASRRVILGVFLG